MRQWKQIRHKWNRVYEFYTSDGDRYQLTIRGPRNGWQYQRPRVSVELLRDWYCERENRYRTTLVSSHTGGARYANFSDR